MKQHRGTERALGDDTMTLIRTTIRSVGESAGMNSEEMEAFSGSVWLHLLDQDRALLRSLDRRGGLERQLRMLVQTLEKAHSWKRRAECGGVGGPVDAGRCPDSRMRAEALESAGKKVAVKGDAVEGVVSEAEDGGNRSTSGCEEPRPRVRRRRSIDSWFEIVRSLSQRLIRLAQGSPDLRTGASSRSATVTDFGSESDRIAAAPTEPTTGF